MAGDFVELMISCRSSHLVGSLEVQSANPEVTAPRCQRRCLAFPVHVNVGVSVFRRGHAYSITGDTRFLS
jgi:hypothetical protein